MVEKKIVTLLTDFGTADPYVAEMKAVILSICPDARLMDITHQIAKYDVKMGAHILARSVGFFPKGTVHVAVVDPRVGGGRKPIVADANSAVFVGPDNGLLIPAAKRAGLKHVYQIEREKYMLQKVSATFHGRDIFAPAAAYLAAGTPPSTFGRELSSYLKPRFAQAKASSRGVTGEVIYVDSFGNLVTNIESGLLRRQGVSFGGTVKLALGSHKPVAVKFLRAYSEAARGALLLTVGSGDFIEVSANLADASKLLKAKTGMNIKILTREA